MKYYMNTYSIESHFIVAVCDESLIGKSFRENNKVLDLQSNAGFYKGTLVEIEDVKKAIPSATTLNLVGECIIKEAIMNEWCNESNILYIDGIPHLQIYKCFFR